MNRPTSGGAITVALFFLVAVVVGMPFAVMWAVNTLFATSLEPSWSSWWAVWVLMLAFSGGGSSKT